MKLKNRGVLNGILFAIFSMLLTYGSIAIAVNESSYSDQAPVFIPIIPTAVPSSTTIALPTTLPTAIPSSTHFPTQSQDDCTYPADWIEIVIQPGDTLESLAQAYQTTSEQLSQGNCLPDSTLIPGDTLLVPPSSLVAATTSSGSPCPYPPGWVPYTVKTNDTLFQISVSFGVTVSELQQANCLGDSTNIRVGSQIYVPDIHINTPQVTNTLPASSTPSPPATKTSVPPSPSPSPTPTSTPSPTTTPGA